MQGFTNTMSPAEVAAEAARHEVLRQAFLAALNPFPRPTLRALPAQFALAPVSLKVVLEGLPPQFPKG